jgi:hypothetical protein
LFCTTACPAKIDAVSASINYETGPLRFVFSPVSAGQAFTWDVSGVGTCVTAGEYQILLSFNASIATTRNLCTTLHHNVQQYTHCWDFRSEAADYPTLVKSTTQDANYVLDCAVGDTIAVDIMSQQDLENTVARLYSK